MTNYFFFTKIFALTFALGVVSGITMSFQFGTNWPGFMEKVGNIAGPMLAYEVLTAFFLEATFLGIMLFGFRRVPSWIHTTSTFLVAFGTTLSAFWILVLNSWMHTPIGYEMIDGQAHATNWFDIIFNPSMPYRLIHMLLASGLTASFLIAGISAYRYLRGDHFSCVTKAIKTGVMLAAFLIPVQIFMGDMHGLNTVKYQPAKIAAMEGLWKTQKGAPLVLFGIPNKKTQSNDYSIEIPKLASLILTHDLNGEVTGIDAFSGIHPPVSPVFWGFRLMVGLGVLMLIVSWIAAYQIRKKNIPSKPVLYILVAMTFSGWIATLSGWYVTEIGRQPWIVQNLMTTSDALGSVPGGMVATSLAAYLCTYLLLLFAYISTLFYMSRRAGHGGNRDPELGKAQGVERRTPISALAK